MHELDNAIKAFAAGQLDYAGLLRVLGGTLRDDPGAVPATIERLNAALEAGELPAPVHADFLKRIEQFSKANASSAPRPKAPPPAASTDSAASAPSPKAPPPAAPADDGDADEEDADDRTVMRAPSPPPAEEEDRTRLSTGHRLGGGGDPSASGGAGQSRPMPGSTGQSGGTGGAGTGSSWGHPSQWTGAGRGDAPLAVDSVIKERFVLQAEIGKGGMGVVFKALDLRKQEALDRNPYVAVKVLNEEFKRHPESLKALQREARKAQDLAHPNIVNVFDFDRDGDDVYMTMEYLEGEPLDELIQKQAMSGLPKDEAFPIIRGMALALNYAHEKGIIHSDFKPANCFLNKDGVVKVFDFGIARAAKHSDDAEGEKTLFDAGTLGALTPAYASCEMLDGDEPDKRDDIYALGCTAYELLAGKHPFGKKKATVARTKKLTPATIKGLSKREYRALVRALAFDRDDRSASAMHFLDELMPKKSGRGLVIGASAAAAVMLAVLGGVVIPPWLHERKMEQYVVSLRDGTDEEIWQVLPEVLALPDGDQSDIFGTVKDRVIDAYERRINEQIDASRGRYDYPAAERFVSELRSLFTDSQRVSSIDSRVDEGKRQEELRQTTRYNDLLAAGALLPKDDEDDITDVLAIMRQVAPDSTLLTDPRLSGAYAEAAEAQLENDLNLGLARQLLEAGLVEFPNDATMVDLLDSVSARQRRIEMAARIEELETQVAAAAPGLASVEDIAALRDTLLELGELNAESEVLAAARTRAGSIVSSVLDDRVESREWVQATGLLQRYSPVLDETFVQTQRDRITAAEDSHTARMTGLFDEFLRAVQAGRLDSPATGSAQDFLQQLVDAGADAAMLQQARSGLGQAYLSRAREARAATNYDEARAQVQLGLNVQPGETLERSLLAENTEIDTSEQLQQTLADEAARERLAAERQARIEALRDEFQQGLRADTFRTETASALLQTLDQLAAVSPTDPLLTNGRAEVGRRLTELARAEAAAGNWDAAIELATDSLVVIPDSELLSSTLADLRSQRDANERQVQAEQLQQRRDRLDALLASPQYNDNWDNEVRNELAALSSMMAADDPYLSARRDQAARLYLGQATERRLEQRFSEANAMLDRGLRFAQLAEIETERELVEAARAAFEAERAQQNRLAKIEGDKQTFLVQARADSVTKAKATLATLSQALPANDTFLTTTAPDALASAYERLAGQSAERGSLDAALRFANAGLEYMPDRASLVQARDDYDRRNNRQRVSNTLSSGSASDVAGLTSLLGTVRAQDDNYASTEQEYADLLASRIRRLERSDYEQAQGLLTAGRSLFSGNATLASLSLTAPVVTPPVQEPPPVATVTPPPTTTPPPATTTTPTQTASRPGKACTPSLAGYGSRGGRGVCYDNLPGNVRGPDLVVVPAAPGGQVYAITRYEVTAGEYADYCRISGECSYTARAENLPLTDVSLADAEKFINWLSGVTAANYRLPSVDEWEHAAGANGSQPSRDYNCQIRDIQGQLVKGLGLVSVNSGDRNGWGLYNYVGNAQEWVRAGSGVQARGGAYTDSLSNCSISLSRQHSGNADPVTGFRLVRVID